jgi:hypothetical protein
VLNRKIPLVTQHELAYKESSARESSYGEKTTYQNWNLQKLRNQLLG